MLPRLDDWLAQAFAPTRLETTIDRLYEAQDNQPSMTDDADAAVADCDDKLARYRQALEAGADPALVAAWTADVQTRKAQALVRKRSRRQQQRMTKADRGARQPARQHPHTVLRAADPDDKAEVYRQLTDQPEGRLV